MFNIFKKKENTTSASVTTNKTENSEVNSNIPENNSIPAVPATVEPEGFTIKEIEGDLLKAPKESMLAHCISGDYSLGAGLAAKIDEKFDMRYELFYNYDIPLGEKYNKEYLGKALKVKQIYNLVTKPTTHSHPTYENLQSALEDVRDDMVANNYTMLAIPRLGCGMDKMRWDKVKGIVEEVFKDTDIKITVYSLKNKKGNSNNGNN